MASGRPSIMKRQKEHKRAEKKRDKSDEKAQRKAEKMADKARKSEMEEDPDIAGIVPGPQPLPFDESGSTVDLESEDEGDEGDEQSP